MYGSIVAELWRLNLEEYPKILAVLKTAPMDKAAGIAHAPIPTEQLMDRAGRMYGFHVAKVLHGKAVTPHFHADGDEPYLFVTPGEMNLGIVAMGTQREQVIWIRRSVQPGDLFIVEQGKVHSFLNTGSEPAIFLFACPDTHLTDDGDRHSTNSMINAMPPW